MAVFALVRGNRTLAKSSFAAGMLLFSAQSACTGMTLRATSAEEMAHWQGWAHLVSGFLAPTWLLFTAVYARGNAARFLTRGRIALVGAFLLAGIGGLVFRDQLVLAVITPDDAAVTLGLAGVVVHVSLLLGLILALMDLERTYRASVGLARWRIKYLLLGLIVIFVQRIYTSSQALLYQALDLSIAGIGPAALLVGQVLIARSFLRPGHFTADLYPSQSVLRGSITVIVAGAYLLAVGVLAKLVARIGGDTALPLQAFVVLISLVIFAIAAQSDHVRMRLRRFVSRHFRRPQLDFRTTWQQFTTHATTSSDVPELCRNVVRVVAATFEALSVTVWLVHERRDALVAGASSTAAPEMITTPPAEAAQVAALIRFFEQYGEPVDLEGENSAWALALKRWHPSEFPTGGHRVCIPLVARGELRGLITLGDRVGGFIDNAADLDVFKCVGDHVAASLLNAQLAQRLMQVKEVESFQLMATFFVHDLKNAANTLNLLLRNLPEHFHDPQFREDALRGCAKTVAHINTLVGRLGELRQELRVAPRDTDLNELVRRVLADFPPAAGITVTHVPAPVPAVALDPEQMRKVFINLLHNAREAIAASGTIHVATGQQGDQAFVAVVDSGCGMTPEFMRGSLFRPFQTTKQRGLGIGMFQSKMIVEAHGGRIDVESTPGRGSSFRIVLPCPVSRA